jgi:hypothetical protein
MSTPTPARYAPPRLAASTSLNATPSPPLSKSSASIVVVAPVVMANAVEGLKQRGWNVAPHQDDAGLADAIRRFALL